MPRTISVALPRHLADTLLPELRNVNGIIGVRLDRGSSVTPPGDVLTINATNPGLHNLLRLFVQRGMTGRADVTITTSMPLTVISAPHEERISTDPSDAAWEEIRSTITLESSMNFDGLALMVIAGVIATLGILSDALHLVIGAMVIAPGFEPLARISLGVVTRGKEWRHGLIDTAKGYAVMLAAAVATTLVMGLMRVGQPGSEASYLGPGSLVAYWTSASPSGILASVVASIAGGLVLTSNRSVLTAGVMIALALLPGIAIGGIGLAHGQWAMAWTGFSRFLLESAVVIVGAGLVFLLKRFTIQKRDIAPGA